MSVSPEELKREILEAELRLLQNGGNQRLYAVLCGN